MKKIILFFIFSFVFSLLLYSQNALEIFNKGEQYFHQQKWDDALFYYKKSLQENPYYTKAILKIIEINLRIKNYKEAQKYIDKLLTIDPKNIKG